MKKALLFLAMIMILPLAVNAQSEEELLRADSLFALGKYTQSFAMYEKILEEEQSYSPAMLLKMAYIKEGLGQYGDALYYLNLHYIHSADREILGKMEELASEHDLRGYDVNDEDFVYSFFYRYYPFIIGILAALALLLLAMVYRERFRLHQSGKVPAIFMSLILGVIFFLINFGLSYDRGIVNDDTAYLMAGPSAGADVIDVISKGHRLDIEGTEDVWVKTSWDNRTVYIKASKLHEVQF
jgi:tetratricopeptide (TPR) repeat protein